MFLNLKQPAQMQEMVPKENDGRDVNSRWLICWCVDIFFKGVYLLQPIACSIGITNWIAWWAQNFCLLLRSQVIASFESLNQKNWYFLNLKHQGCIIQLAIACVYCIHRTLCTTRTRTIWKIIVELYSGHSEWYLNSDVIDLLQFFFIQTSPWLGTSNGYNLFGCW